MYQKPKKPYPSFPLTPHIRGWVKKINGKVEWFGPPHDHEGALQRYLAKAKDLHAGKQPKVDPDRISVKEVANRFIEYAIQCQAAGKMSLSWLAAYRQALARFINHIGPATAVVDLTPDHFSRFIASRNGKGVNKTVQCIRTVFHHADGQEWCRCPKFGKVFRKETAQERRSHRRPKYFTPAECQKMVGAAAGQLKAMVLLGLNGGLGQSDVATLRVGDIQGDKIDYTRQKTGVLRTVPFWPETLEAITPYLDGKGSEELVFLTRHGKPWVREQLSQKAGGIEKVSTIDSVSLEFGKLLAELGIWTRNEKGRAISDGRGFYTLRRTFRSHADAQGDQRAIDRVMGHAAKANDMGATYTQFVAPERLRAVVDHVRKELLTPPSPALRKKSNRASGIAKGRAAAA